MFQNKALQNPFKELCLEVTYQMRVFKNSTIHFLITFCFLSFGAKCKVISVQLLLSKCTHDIQEVYYLKIVINITISLNYWYHGNQTIVITQH